MGYDCTLHVVDEETIRARFVPKLLGQLGAHSPFDEREDAVELWQQARDALAGGGHGANHPRSVAHLLCLLAVTYCAAELPYHYERGFCLSLWNDQPDGLDEQVPKELIGDPEQLFEAVIAQHPELKGEFPTELEGNYCTGMYVPAEQVRPLLQWATAQVSRYGKPDQRLFRGLLAVLQDAVDKGLGYWEGTELPVPPATMTPAGLQPPRCLEELPSPEGVDIRFAGEAVPILVLTHSLAMGQPRYLTAFADLTSWPPTFEFAEEYALTAARSRAGRWVTCSLTPGQRAEDQRSAFRARVSDRPGGERTALLPKDERSYGLSWADFVDERVVAVLRSEKRPGWLTRDLPAVPLIERDGGLVRIKELSPARSEKPSTGIAHLDDGSDVLLWEGDGYELRDGRFQLTFPIGHTQPYYEPTVPFGQDGFFWLQHELPEPGRYTQTVRYARRGEPPVEHLPQFELVMHIAPGPDGAILLRPGHNKEGYVGLVYWPDEGRYIPLEADLFDASDPEADATDIDFLHWAGACGRLIAGTHRRLWALPIETILALPSYRASTNRRIKKPE